MSEPDATRTRQATSVRGPAPAADASLPGRDWHLEPVDDVVRALATDPTRGLDPAEATARLDRDGPNTLAARRQEPWWEEVLESLREPLQLLLVAVGVAYFLLGQVDDALTILAVILVVSAIEVFNELRAKRAIASLSSLGAPSGTVVRGGTPRRIPSADLVAGDLVLLGPGDRVPADLRLVESAALQIDESSLTGESVPVAKGATESPDPATELAERRTMAYSSTLVTAGKGRGVVIATGRATEVGRISSLAEESREAPTPLQRSMRELSSWLVWVALGFSVLVPVLGVVVAGLPLEDMLLTGLTLAFATIPEELPILITIVLGIGAYRLARRHAIVKRLRAAETLGAVSVVATDKTGTLTENQMRLQDVLVGGDRLTASDLAANPVVERLMTAAVLANDAQISRSKGRVEFVGDPTDTALLRASSELGRDPQTTRDLPDVAELPFDDERKRVSVVVQRGAERLVAMKGSPESVLEVCSDVLSASGSTALDVESRQRLLSAAEAMAADGLRVLAVADRTLPDGVTIGDIAAIERDMTLLGLVGLEDPPRPEAAGAVRALRDAGVTVYMLTGDHPTTAMAIAERVGIRPSTATRGRDLDQLSDTEFAQALETTRVFARITPEHKLRIVRALKARGAAVAVTGDGVNDAPALREATIGVAMGNVGTDVARESADLILADDNLATVTAAVEAGRVLYANLRKAVRFYLAAKVALVTASIVAVLLRLPVPFEPVQIILMELFMDVGASATFVAEPPEEDVMRQPPRDPRGTFFDRSMQLGIMAGGLSLAAVVLVSYLWATRSGAGTTTAQAAAFAAWMIGNIVLAAHMRAERTPLVPGALFSNRAYLVWALAAVLTVIVGFAIVPLSERFHLVPLSAETWVVLAATAVLLPSWWEVWKRVRRRRM
jgi:P-type Ca2+ transporter type 2C